MTRRVQVTLDGPKTGTVSVLPQAIQNLEADELSVRRWSEAAVEKMFEAAYQALQSDTEEPENLS